MKPRCQAQGAVRRGQRIATTTPVAIKRIAHGAGRGPEANRELQIALKLQQQDSQQQEATPRGSAIADYRPIVRQGIAVADCITPSTRPLTSNALLRLATSVATILFSPSSCTMSVVSISNETRTW